MGKNYHQDIAFDLSLNNGYMATRNVTFNTGDGEERDCSLPDARATRQSGAEYGFCRRYESAGGSLLCARTTIVQDATAHLDVGRGDST
ncbi:hypothetical protein ACNKHR_08780 [Shigella flexneri]